MPPWLELVERAANVDLVDVQYRLTTTGSCGWLAAPALAGGAALQEVVATGAGTLDALVLPDGAIAGYQEGEVVVEGGDPVLAKLVAVGSDPESARAELVRAIEQVRVDGVPIG
jgi:hypothetical protein